MYGAYIKIVYGIFKQRRRGMINDICMAWATMAGAIAARADAVAISHRAILTVDMAHKRNISTAAPYSHHRSKRANIGALA